MFVYKVIALEQKEGTGNVQQSNGHTSLCYVALPSCWQAHHDDADSGVLDLNSHAISFWSHRDKLLSVAAKTEMRQV